MLFSFCGKEILNLKNEEIYKNLSKSIPNFFFFFKFESNEKLNQKLEGKVTFNHGTNRKTLGWSGAESASPQHET